MKKIITLVLATVFISTVAFAQEAPELKLRSKKTARILSLMPLNSPMMFYVKRPIRGTVYTLLEGGGLFLAIVGTYRLATYKEAEPKGDLSDLFLFVEPVAKLAMGMVTAVGYAAWLGPWLHTVIRASPYTDDCNEKIKQKANMVSVLPMIDVRENASIYGIRLQYHF